MIEMTFETLKNICRFAELGYDEHKYSVELTCRHNLNHPKGCSWGDCTYELCPLILQGITRR